MLRARSQRPRLNTELLHAGDQSSALDSQPVGGAVGAGNATLAFLESAQNLFPLTRFPKPGGSRAAVVRGQLADRDLQCGTMGKNHGTLDEILQLADIAGPMPARQLFHGRS